MFWYVITNLAYNLTKQNEFLHKNGSKSETDICKNGLVDFTIIIM